MEEEADRRWAEDAGPAESTAEPPAPAAVAPAGAPESPAAGHGPAPALNAHVAGDAAPIAAPAMLGPVEQLAQPIEIRTLGEIRIVIDGEDVAPELMHAPALAFMVLYLLAWEARQPGDRVTREHLGEETFGGQNPQARRRGVSQRLTNLKREFPQLRSRIRSEGEYLRFDSTGCAIDVRGVLDVAERVRAAEGRLAGELQNEARQALALAAREFLPGWDGIESKGTLGGSGAAEVIEEVRDRVVAGRLDILAGLADAALARDQLDDAVSLLEEALGLRPERTALARKLADLHERNGHPQRAARLREEYGLDQAS
jgi:DNA-binding SARP family transcriptional activator